MSIFMPLHGNVLFEKEICRTIYRLRICIGDSRALYFDNISAENVSLFLLKRTCKSLIVLLRLILTSILILFLRLWMFFNRAGSDQQAQQ